MTIGLSRYDLLKVCLRLTFIQSAWTFTTMQSEGFVYCIAPALSKIFPEKSRLKSVLKHYQTPINTHPFLVSVLAGVILKMETEGKSTKAILSYLKTTMGPLAALGDPFFHGALAPFASVVAALFALLFGNLAGIVTLLIVFNSIHLAIRVTGVFLGYKKGSTVVSDVGKWISNSKTSFLRMAAGITGGILTGLLVYRYTGVEYSLITIPLAGIACMLVSVLLNMNRSIWIYVLPAFMVGILVLEVIL